MCITNMDNKASELGCPKNDHGCLCEKENYRFGVRDCTAQACPDEDSAAVVKIALKTCPKGSTSNPNGNGEPDSTSSASGSDSTGGAGSGDSDSSTTRSGSGSDSEPTDAPKSTGSDAKSSGTASATATSSGADSVSLLCTRLSGVIY